jgi:hypothetical protein
MGRKGRKGEGGGLVGGWVGGQGFLLLDRSTGDLYFERERGASCLVCGRGSRPLNNNALVAHHDAICMHYKKKQTNAGLPIHFLCSVL